MRAITTDPVARIGADDVDEMAIPSYLHGNPLIRWLMWRRYEVIAGMARFDDTTSVLEFGCGSGVFLPEMNRTAGTVYAIDIFPEYAQRLNERRGLNTQFISEVADLEDQSIDVIIAADVLEHIDDLNPWLQLFSSKLVRNGRFIVSGPTENRVYQLGRIVAGFGDKGDYHHTNIDRLIEKITQSGFREVSRKNLPFNVPPHLFRVCEFVKVS